MFEKPDFRNYCINKIYLLNRCKDFIPFCVSYIGNSQNNHISCCGDIFDPKPTFSSAGACFTTKKFDHLVPNYLSSKPLEPIILLLLNVSKTYSKGFDMKLASPFTGISGASIAFHSQDHGLAAIDDQGPILRHKIFDI